jgi:hypothetical protein
MAMWLFLGSPYLIRHNAKEGRFGIDDDVKFWVKRAIDLKNGDLKILKLVFYEKFTSHIGSIAFECFRSPRKEARILDLVAGHKNFMHGYAIRDQAENLIRVLDFIEGKRFMIMCRVLVWTIRPIFTIACLPF